MSWTAGAGVVEGGQKRVLVLMGDTKTMTEADNLVGECTSISGIGAGKEINEFGGLHYTTKHKATGQSTPTDISLVENLTSEQLNTIRTKYKNGAKFYLALAKADGTVLYGCHGELSAWNLEVNDGNTCTLGYTVVCDQDDVSDITVTPASQVAGT